MQRAMVPPSDSAPRPFAWLTLGAASLMAALSSLLVITGGAQISLGGLKLSAHDWRRPAGLAAVLLIVRAVRASRAWLSR